MPIPLLATKFYIPPRRPKAVPRPRLVEKLLDGLRHPGRFALLSGPAGFGKTTLLSEFAARLDQPAAWLSLDEGDREPVRFWTYFIAACQSALDGVGESALELLHSAQPLPVETVPTILINDLASQDRTVVLVLDDYHAIDSPSIHAGLAFLLDHLPDNLRLVVSTRIDPPWPLARYRARGRLVEIRARDLRFNRDEAAEFFHQTMDLDLSVQDVDVLEERTEGWAAGLQLAALSMQGRSDTAAFVQDFAGSHLYVAEYLLEEVLRRQPEQVQSFLLQTSVLERLNADLCDAVTGGRDGQAVLAGLDRANIFLVPLDDRGEWYRYHHLFAELLKARLGQKRSAEEAAALQVRAADWFERHGFLPEAIHHAMAAGDFERAASLVDEMGKNIMFRDQYNLLKSWLDVLPHESFQTHPRLEIYRFLIGLSMGTLDMFEQTLEEKEKLVEALPPSPENDRLRLEARAFLASFYAHQNTTRAVRIAEEVLSEVGEGDLRLRANLYSALYRAYGMDGDIDRSAPAYRECFRLALAGGEYGMISNTTMVRAFDLCQYGRLDEAARYCQEILDAGAGLKRKVFYPAGAAYIGLAGIHLERNDLEAAETYLHQGWELVRQGATYGLYTGYVQLARLREAKGDLEGALEEIRLLEQHLQRWDFTLAARQVSVLLGMGDIAGASQLIAPIQELFGDSHYAHKLPLIADEAFSLCLARIYIARGELEQAGRILDRIQSTVEPGKRYGRLMEVYLLRAKIAQKQAGRAASEAAGSMARALELAEPAGFVRLILEEGPDLVPLLRAVLDRKTISGRIRNYARKLLEAAGAEAGSRPAGEMAGLVEPLTSRELEVLRLLAAGDSNREIAAKLFITVRTVKKHTGNIYGKLNVSSRTQAAVRARELGLLPEEP